MNPEAKLVEVAPGLWRVAKPDVAPARSDLPRPNVISDEMLPTEQVDGKFYTCKRRFRAIGRALGLTEVGNEQFKTKLRASANRETKVERRRTLERAIAQYRAGRRPRS